MLTRCPDDADQIEHQLLFDPHRLPEGVFPSDDEILMARRAAYAHSYVRRASEVSR